MLSSWCVKGMCTGNPRVQQHRNRRYRHKAILPLPLGDGVVFTRISSRGSLRGVLAAPAAPPRGSRLGLQAQERRHGDSNTSPVGSGPRSVTGGRLPADSGGGAGAAATPPRGGAQLGARGPARPRSAAAGAQRRRHVFRGQRERPAARGGAAQARGRRGEDQAGKKFAEQCLRAQSEE
nr:guanine nucleotide-binding protein G(I)/G(S)/G(O) subunit gamma-10 isoform X1 [Oryctolagus cuniculus]